ncbi:MAG: hemolysin III family protein [Porticoccaceae bacterium]|jgi:hemolysin III|nr:hemolysin III family protein [Porticoccaceae bacterium]
MNLSTATARSQSLGEEIANSVSHGVAALLSLVALPILVVGAVQQGGALNIVSSSIFGVSLVLLYLASTLCHSLPQGKAKRVFEILDHCAIYLLIAGTYTPFLLVSLGGGWGWSLFGVIWGLALLGVLFKSIFGIRYPMASNALYLLMGWLVLVAIKPMMAAVPSAGLAWLLAGGLAYTLGVVFFVMDSRWKFAHFIWHFFVVAGSACHFVAVFFYVR